MFYIRSDFKVFTVVLNIRVNFWGKWIESIKNRQSKVLPVDPPNTLIVIGQTEKAI